MGGSSNRYVLLAALLIGGCASSSTKELETDGVQRSSLLPGPLGVVLGSTADAPFSVSDRPSGLSVGVRMEGALPVDATPIRGGVVFRRGHVSGADVVVRASAFGVEDFVAFRERPAEERLRYQIALGDAVAGMRLFANSLELLDARGTPRLRVAPPYLIDAEGERGPVVLEVEDCEYDQDPRAPHRRPVVPPGASTCTLTVTWTGAPYPLVVDPFWTATGMMMAARQSHSSTLLSDGRVLVAGGLDGVPLSSAEVFDPMTETWSVTGALTGARHSHDGALLNDGRVLVAGGYDGPGTVATVETYDPVTGQWSATGSLQQQRANHSVVQLGDGRVLAAGGVHTAELDVVELWDPATAQWSMAANLAVPRMQHEASMLLDGRVLVVGGELAGAELTSTEIYDPVAGAWATVAMMGEPRVEHTATTLVDGRVLVVGGWDGAATLKSAEVFDPATQGWTAVAPSTNPWRLHSATRLDDGRVLMAGGWTMAEIYDPAMDAWTTTANTVEPRRFHGAHLLADGRVIVAGGASPAGALKSAEIFQPKSALGEACTIADDCASGHCADGVCCDTDCQGGLPGDCLSCAVAGSVGVCGPEPVATPCGPTAAVCHVQDACDAAGSCVDQGLAPDGTTCPSGTCVAGVCEPPSGMGGGGGVSGGGGDAGRGAGGAGADPTTGGGGAQSGEGGAASTPGPPAGGGEANAAGPSPSGCSISRDADRYRVVPWALLVFGLARRRRRVR